MMRFDRRCDCETGICGRGVGVFKIGGEGTGRGEDFEGLQGKREGGDAGG